MFSRLSSIFSKKQDIPEVTLDTYANLPIFQMLNKEEPFNQWNPPEINIPTQFVDIFEYFVCMYQMYMFFALTTKRFGQDIADKVVKLQVDRLGNASIELSQQFKNGIKQVNSCVLRNADNPVVIEVGGKDLEMPIEYCLAMEFLTLGEDAPFPVDGDSLKAGRLPEFHGADHALAECLEYGKHSAISYFELFTGRVKVVL